MISAILHLGLSLLTAISAIATYRIWKKNKSQRKVLKDFLVFFIFFIAYHLFLSLPFFLFKADLIMMAWGYNLAVFFVFLILVPIYRTIIVYVVKMPSYKSKVLLGTLIVIGFITVALQIYDFHLPVISSSGFIIWNANLISSSIVFSTVVVAEIWWLILFLKNRPLNLSLRGKVKVTLYTLSFIMFTIASIYFIAYNLAMIYIAFIAVTLGTILMTIEFLIPQEEN